MFAYYQSEIDTVLIDTADGGHMNFTREEIFAYVKVSTFLAGQYLHLFHNGEFVLRTKLDPAALLLVRSFLDDPDQFAELIVA